MWNEIKTQQDTLAFMRIMHSFHDSCLKELQYISGAFIEKDLSMHPVNDRRVLRVIFQRQFQDNTVVLLEFEGVNRLILNPIDEKYTCEIQQASLLYKNGSFIWCDEQITDETDFCDFSGILISASKLRWRTINYIETRDYYQIKKTGDGM